MAFNGFPDHCYFVRRTPISALKRLYNTQFANTEWCMALQNNIDECGLASPILVDNRTGEYKVLCGNNRVQALGNLGWTHVPCLINGGPIPDEWDREVIANEHIARDLLRDGRMEVRHERIYVFDAMTPEHMKYPTNPEPYRKEDTDAV